MGKLRHFGSRLIVEQPLQASTCCYLQDAAPPAQAQEGITLHRLSDIKRLVLLCFPTAWAFLSVEELPPRVRTTNTKHRTNVKVPPEKEPYSQRHIRQPSWNTKGQLPHSQPEWSSTQGRRILSATNDVSQRHQNSLCAALSWNPFIPWYREEAGRV